MSTLGGIDIISNHSSISQNASIFYPSSREFSRNGLLPNFTRTAAIEGSRSVINLINNGGLQLNSEKKASRGPALHQASNPNNFVLTGEFKPQYYNVNKYKLHNFTIKVSKNKFNPHVHGSTPITDGNGGLKSGISKNNALAKNPYFIKQAEIHEQQHINDMKTHVPNFSEILKGHKEGFMIDPYSNQPNYQAVAEIRGWMASSNYLSSINLGELSPTDKFVVTYLQQFSAKIIEEWERIINEGGSL